MQHHLRYEEFSRIYNWIFSTYLKYKLVENKWTNYATKQHLKYILDCMLINNLAKSKNPLFCREPDRVYIESFIFSILWISQHD